MDLRLLATRIAPERPKAHESAARKTHLIHHCCKIDSKQQTGQRAPGSTPLHPGDLAKLLIIALCIGFLALILLHEYGVLNFFSQSYLEDGFCLTNRHKAPSWNQGHLLAFYSDTLTAIMMFVMAYAGKTTFCMSEPATRPIFKNAISLFGHGCGHLFLGIRAYIYGRADRVFEDLNSVERFGTLIFLYPVWFAFLRDKGRSFAKTMLLATFHNVLQVYFLPTRFFFTHVLKTVLVGSAVRWLLRPESQKTKYYTYEAWLVDIPILLMTYFEALACDSFLINYGGHVFFDLVVPFGFVLYFFILVYEEDFATGKNGNHVERLKQI